MNREKLIETAKDTILKCETEYSWMISGSENIYYNVDDLNYQIKSDPKELNIKIVQKTTVEAILANNNKKFAVLNFASAKYAGGGFLSGAVAQEEALARASSLYPMLKRCTEFYIKEDAKYPFYTDKIIYTTPIVIFKDDYGNIVSPVECDVITCAAPNYNKYNAGVDVNRHKDIIATRFTKVLMSAIENKQRNLILGAWGCGIFQNPPEINARVFGEVLIKYAGYFDDVIFAIPDMKNFTIFVDNL